MNAPLPLSVCMIARDEEANLAVAIGSVKAVAQEVIVVDTGSRDQTMQIATDLGARVLSVAWQNDFSLARNVALGAARGDWILSLDADQQLDANCLPALRRAMASPAKAQLLHIDLMGEDATQAPVSSFPTLRLFRRDERIRFRGRVHEDVSGSLVDMGCGDWPDSGVRLRDTGYIDAGERRRKRERNLSLLEQARTEAPGDLFVAYKLATTLPASRYLERRAILAQAMQVALTLHAEALCNMTFMARLISAAVDELVDQGRLCDAATLCQNLSPKVGPAIDFAAGRALARAGCMAPAADLLTRYLDSSAQELRNLGMDDAAASPAEACRWLGWMMLVAGNITQSRSWLDRALSLAREDQAIGAGCDAIRLSLAAGDIQQAAEKLQDLQLHAANSPKALAEIMLTAAEISVAIGDLVGAIPLAQAARTPGDDRAAALLAAIELSDDEPSQACLQELYPAVIGRRFDTLATRAKIARRLGYELGFEIPAATRRLVDPP